MIIRIFQVPIRPEYRDEFERDYNTISVDTVRSHKGLVSCHIGPPSGNLVELRGIEPLTS